MWTDITVIGLALDMIGVAMVFFFTIPKPSGPTTFSWGFVDSGDEKSFEKAKKRNIALSYIGLTLILIGFALQICGQL